MESLAIKDPLVSIVIPVYNGSNYLKVAIESALSQTYDNIEILVVNDGSTDNGATEKIAKSYGNKIRYFEKENGGVSTALNLGIKMMNGDYFAWLSHDDVYHPNNIIEQIKNIKNCSKNLASACSTGIFDDIVNLKFNDYNSVPEKVLLSSPLDHYRRWIYGCSLLVPKNLLVEVGYFNENNKTAQDVEFIFEILNKTSICILSYVLVFRREHQDQGYNKFISTVLIENAELIKRKITEYGPEYFTGVKATKFKKYFTFIFLAFKLLSDNRFQKLNQFEVVYWLLDKSADIYPCFLNPIRIIKNLPVKRLIIGINLAKSIRRILLSLKSL